MSDPLLAGSKPQAKVQAELGSRPFLSLKDFETDFLLAAVSSSPVGVSPERLDG